MRSTVFSARSFPETQCTGASKWVPVCSPVSKPFQYHAGPRSSYRESSQILNAGVLFHWLGSGSKGVCGLNVWVRSTTRSRPARSSSTSCVKTFDIRLLPPLASCIPTVQLPALLRAFSANSAPLRYLSCSCLLTTDDSQGFLSD